MRENDSTLLLLEDCRTNELDSKGAGAMGDVSSGVGVVGGGGSPRSNQGGIRACHRKGGVSSGVEKEGHGSCTWVRRLSELDDC